MESVRQDTTDKKRLHIDRARMSQNLATETDRRGIQRFRVNAPLTVLIGDQKIPAYTRDLSNRGVYFYLASSDCRLIDCDLEFMVELPPEITLSTSCRIQCRGKAVRKEEVSANLAGVAAQIVDYSIHRETTPIS